MQLAANLGIPYLRVMKILLLSATLAEIEPLLSFFNFREGKNSIAGHEFRVLTGGVGMVATAYALGRAFSTGSYDLAINAGIAGSFQRSLQLGEVVNVTHDCFAELGAEDGEKFLSLEELGFGSSWETGISPGGVPLNLSGFKEVWGITVNKVHGAEESIKRTIQRLDPDVESMEGASFFYSCRLADTPGLQLRAVSNYVERRNRSAWDIPLAIKNLNAAVIELLNTIL